MIHLIKTKKGFGLVIVARNGELVWQTPPKEQYASKGGCYKAIRVLMKAVALPLNPVFNEAGSVVFQDDTLDVPKVFQIMKSGKPMLMKDIKAKKKYTGSK